MELATLSYRIQQGEEYLTALEESLRREWAELFAEYQEERLVLPQAMVLVHPEFYKDRSGEAGRCRVRGPRQFSNTTGRYSSSCMADQIWLSPCTLECAEDDLQSDHLFPYALGGPTRGENQLFLCPVHNRSKAGDIHLFPWERGKPKWLADQVERIRKLLL